MSYVRVEDKCQLTLLVGKSGSGKDHLVRALGLRPVVSRTTRAPRVHEVDGISKHFKTLDDFLEDYNRGLVVADTKYNGNRYWTTWDDLFGKDVYIIDPAGIIRLKHELENSKYANDILILVTYVDAPWYRRLSRMCMRGDAWIEAFRRLFHDRKAFSERILSKLGIQYTIRT